MEANRIGAGQSNLPSQVGGTQSKSGEESFHNMAKSDGYDKDSLDKAVSERTRLTRTKKADRTKKKSSSLFVISDDDNEGSEEPVYRTVMVDGILFTLRLLAVA